MKNVKRLAKEKPPQYNRRFLTVADVIFSAVVVAPTVVGYWRSVWELMGAAVMPGAPLTSALISTGIGIGGHILFATVQFQLNRNFVETSEVAKCHHPRRHYLHYIRFLIVSRLYTVLFAFVCVNGWRGPWQLLDMYRPMEVAAVAATTAVGAVALAAMRTLRNISAPPFAVAVDQRRGYFEVLTMFRVTMEERKSLYILDCLFSVIIVGTLVVFVWRGCWALFDIYLYPDNEIKSAWGSLIIGYSVVLVAFLLQPLMRWLCDRTKGAVRLLIADLFILFSFLGTINVWRGIWNLLNLYLLPDDLELSCWITHWVCLIILIMLGCSNSLLVRGVYIDAEEPAGKCVVFPCHYLRVILQEKNLTGNESNRNGIEGGHQEDTADINVECGPNGSAQLKHLPPPNSNVNVNNNNNNNSPGKRQQNSDDNNMVLDSCTKNHVYSINCDKTIPHQK